jgi:hypothetical protein
VRECKAAKKIIAVEGDLIKDMKVRWNSTHKMNARYLKYQIVLCNLFKQIEKSKVKGLTRDQEDKFKAYTLTDTEWIILKSLTV